MSQVVPNGQEPTSIVLRIAVPAAVIAGDTNVVAGVCPVAGRIVSARYTAITTMTGTALANSRHSLLNNLGGAGGGALVPVPTFQWAVGVNATANIAKELTLGAAAALVVAAGDVLQYQSVHDGTGLVDPGGTLEVEIVPALS